MTNFNDMRQGFRNTFFLTIIMGICSSCFLFSCRRDLETKPLERRTLDFVFDSKDSNGSNAISFLANVYNHLPSGFNYIDGDMLASLTDDAVPSSQSNAAWRVATGGYTPFFNPDDNWARMYQAIRNASICYNNIGKVPFKEAANRSYFKAEAQLLRAFFYFQLVQRYGGVPLLGDSVRNVGDDIELPRNSFNECINYIVSECDAAAPLLRKDPVPAQNTGHLSEGAALALKAKALLYAASPLNNSTNDPELWRKAADAAKAVIDLNAFELLPDFATVFTQSPNRELIFFKNESDRNVVETSNGPIGYPTAGGNARTSPTQELVDAFNMKNGLPITDPASGYDPQNPYADRDPRFYQTILYNGAQWLGRPVETFEGGRDKPGTGITQTLTGYYMRKFMGSFENEQRYSTHQQDFIYIRYADILLSYAEALNEYQGPVDAVYDQLISIRARAGIEPGADNLYGLPAGMTKDEMREVIRNERRVELAFEEQRFHDIRRWKIAEQVYTQPLHGVRISVYEATGELTYQKVPVVTPVFHAPKMYRYPILYNILVTNDNLEQTEGW